MIVLILSGATSSSNWSDLVNSFCSLLKTICIVVIRPVFDYFSLVLEHLYQGDVIPLLLLILALDTVRTTLAYLGWVNPRSKLGRIIYGKYDQHVMMMALEELGYEPIAQRREVKKWRRLAKTSATRSGVNAENAAEQLVVLLAKYIVRFPESGEYGGRTLTTSKYYINTMEISHYPDDAKTMATIMMHLIRKKKGIVGKPEVIITPKGGNPLFASVVSDVLGAHLLLAKSSSDKSKANIIGNDPITRFVINFEGSKKITDSREKNHQCILLDCNTSGGSQLCDILSDVGEILEDSSYSIGLEKPTQAYVLFRADDGNVDIEAKFANRGCKLIRFFDLDEETKEMIYAFKSRCDADRRVPDPYEIDDIAEARTILEAINKKGKYYYSTSVHRKHPMTVKVKCRKVKNKEQEQVNKDESGVASS